MGIDSEFNLLAPDSHNQDFYIITDYNFLIFSQCQDHARPSSQCLKNQPTCDNFSPKRV